MRGASTPLALAALAATVSPPETVSSVAAEGLAAWTSLEAMVSSVAAERSCCERCESATGGDCKRRCQMTVAGVEMIRER